MSPRSPNAPASTPIRSLPRTHCCNKLIAQGLARPDPLGIGIDVSVDCAVIDKSGVASAVLYGVGPLTRAAFWEIMAVPDIRVQCAELARHLLTRLTGDAPTEATLGLTGGVA